KSFNQEVLAQPSMQAMQAAGQTSWTNATHLLINNPEHPRYCSCLKDSDLAWPVETDEEGTEKDVFVVQRADGSLAPHTITEPAELFVERSVEAVNLGQQPIEVCTALSKMLFESQQM